MRWGSSDETRPTPSTPASSQAWKTGANDPWSDTVFTSTQLDADSLSVRTVNPSMLFIYGQCIRTWGFGKKGK